MANLTAALHNLLEQPGLHILNRLLTGPSHLLFTRVDGQAAFCRMSAWCQKTDAGRMLCLLNIAGKPLDMDSGLFYMLDENILIKASLACAIFRFRDDINAIFSAAGRYAEMMVDMWGTSLIDEHIYPPSFICGISGCGRKGKNMPDQVRMMMPQVQSALAGGAHCIIMPGIGVMTAGASGEEAVQRLQEIESVSQAAILQILYTSLLRG